MVRQLGAQGVCAGLQGGSDEICVLEAPGRCQGWRVGTCGADVAGPGSGCVQGVVVAWPAAGAVRDTWVTKTAVSPANPGGDAVCTEDTPDATTFVLDVRWNTAHTVAWVDATPKLNNREWCGVHYCVDCPWPNRNALVVCPTRPEGHPARVDCDRKHGTPRWFMAVSGGFAPVGSDEGDPFHLHAPLGATVKACLSTDGATACSAELTLQ
jgi:hypothetical protein